MKVLPNNATHNRIETLQRPFNRLNKSVFISVGTQTVISHVKNKAYFCSVAVKQLHIPEIGEFILWIQVGKKIFLIKEEHTADIALCLGQI